MLNAPTVNSQQPRCAAISLQAPATPTKLSPGDPGYDPETDPDIPAEPELMDWINNMPFAMSKNLARQTLLSLQVCAAPRFGLGGSRPRVLATAAST